MDVILINTPILRPWYCHTQQRTDDVTLFTEVLHGLFLQTLGRFHYMIKVPSIYIGTPAGL